MTSDQAVPQTLLPERIAIIILGRAGTDILRQSAILRRMGCDAAARATDDAARQIAALNARILNTAVTNGPAPFGTSPAYGSNTALVDAAAALITRVFGQAPLILLDAPDLSRTASVWDAALDKAGYGIRIFVTDRSAPNCALLSVQQNDSAEATTTLTAQIAFMRQEISVRGTVLLTYEQIIDDRDRALADLQRQHAETRTNIQRERKALQAARADLEKRTIQLTAAQAEIANLYKSRSFRLTAPLRRLMSWFQ